MGSFAIVSEFEPKGDQPAAFATLKKQLEAGERMHTLLGVTGSGKTYTMAKVIEAVNRPALVLAPNKTLAAQLYHEFKQLFPDNAVEYFVSYYDYYQPEAYIPTTDTYIEKDSSINELIDKMRHSATMSVLTRRDTLVVASVSCIFGLGAPEDYLAMRVHVKLRQALSRDKLLRDLVDMQYSRNDIDFYRGVFRVRGDRVEIIPAYEDSRAIRVDFFGDEIEGLWEVDPLVGAVLRPLREADIFPASHYVTHQRTIRRALETIKAELKERLAWFRAADKLLEAQRLEQRTDFDLEMIRELGYCNGIENYSRHLTGRKAGEPPPTLLDYFPQDFLMFIDESHIGVPQLRAMYKGDRSRKETLVEYGFRLPSALDNRPLQFHETEARMGQVIFVSATPAEYELQNSGENVVELIVRPTGLIDPEVIIRPAGSQVDDLYGEIRKRTAKNERVLVTTLTKRMAEDLTEYYGDMDVRVRYLHSDITTLERMDIIQDLRKGLFDVLIGINLLREGLDIPEVSLVAILDADKEGFLRSTRSLIQTFGRAARNVNGTVLLYADRITNSMRRAMDETSRRRNIQMAFNKEQGIVPESIRKEVVTIFEALEDKEPVPALAAETLVQYGEDADPAEVVAKLEKEMLAAARELAFERAANLRDRIQSIREQILYRG